MQEQEKHPVDELFASRLRDAAQTPSARAWEELQRRTAKKKGSKPAFWWYAAASVLLLVGCFFWLDTRKSVTKQMATKPEKLPAIQDNVAQRIDTPVGKTGNLREKTSQKTADAEQLAISGTQTGNQQPEAENRPLPQKQNQKAAPEKVRAGEKQLVAEKKPTARRQANTVGNTLAESLNKPVAKPIRPGTVDAKDGGEKNAVTGDIATATNELAARALIAENNPVNVTIVTVEIENRVDSLENGVPAPPKNGKASKLLRALKKVKNGELNLDKETLMSWVKDKTNSNRERQ